MKIFTQFWKDFPLIMVTNSNLYLDEISYFKNIELACKSGLRILLFREKHLAFDEKKRMGNSIKNIVSRYSVSFIVNCQNQLDIELAEEMKSDGIHFPENISDTLSIPKNKIIGRSIHSLESLRHIQSTQLKTDYLLLGTIFETTSKPVQPKGIFFIREMKNHTSLPIFAIGGITTQNARVCIENGASGVAVISALAKATNISNELTKFKKCLS